MSRSPVLYASPGTPGSTEVVLLGEIASKRRLAGGL